MKQTVTKILSLSLVLAMLLPAVTACGSSQDDGPETTAETTAVTDAATLSEADIALEAVADANFGGKSFTVLFNNDNKTFKDDVYAEGYATDDSTASAVLNDAVYERNTLFANQCNLVYSAVGKDGTSVNNAMSLEAQSPTGDYQMFLQIMYETANRAAENVLLDYHSLDGIDYDKPWWDAGTLDYALDGKVFFMNGAHNIVDDRVTYLTIFNKALAADEQLPDLYAKVDAGEWTIDYLSEITVDFSKDANGNGSFDDQDIYGIASTSNLGTMFFYGADLRYIYTDKQADLPTLALDAGGLEKATTLLEKVRNLSTAHAAYFPNTTALSRVAFIEDERALFYFEAASYLADCNVNMEDEYGVLPIPKYDKQQERYLTHASTYGTTYSIPSTVSDKEMYGKILSQFVILSYQKVTPAFYDILLTQKNVRDPQSSKMVDMVFANRVYDMAQCYTSLGFSTLFKDAVKDSGNSFVTGYKAASNNFNKNLAKIMKGIAD